MPHPPLYGDRWGIGGDLKHRMCQIPHPSITIQCQIPTLYIHMRICAGTRANACAGQKPHPWGVISWRIPYQAPPLSPTGGGWGVTLIGALRYLRNFVTKIKIMTLRTYPIRYIRNHYVTYVTCWFFLFLMILFYFILIYSILIYLSVMATIPATKDWGEVGRLLTI